jgi:hypothetical protein
LEAELRGAVLEPRRAWDRRREEAVRRAKPSRQSRASRWATRTSKPSP